MFLRLGGLDVSSVMVSFDYVLGLAPRHCSVPAGQQLGPHCRQLRLLSHLLRGRRQFYLLQIIGEVG